MRELYVFQTDILRTVYHDSNNTAAALKKPTILQKVQKNQTVTNVTYLFLLLLDEEPTTNFAVFNLQLLLNVLGLFSPFTTIVFMELLGD